MIIFGFGTKNRTWQVNIENEEKLLVCTYSYFSLFFLPWVVSTSWQMIGEKLSETRSLSYKSVKELIPVNTPKLGIFRRALLPMVLGGLVLTFFIFGFTGQFNTKNSSSPRSNQEIINGGRVFTDQEARQVAKTATDAEFDEFLNKYRKAKNALEIIEVRQMYKKLPDIDENFVAQGETVKTALGRETFDIEDYSMIADTTLESGKKSVDGSTSTIKTKNAAKDKDVYLTVKVGSNDKGEEVVQELYVSDIAGAKLVK